jgi:hypothetical protein
MQPDILYDVLDLRVQGTTFIFWLIFSQSILIATVKTLLLL